VSIKGGSLASCLAGWLASCMQGRLCLLSVLCWLLHVEHTPPSSTVMVNQHEFKSDKKSARKKRESDKKSARRKRSFCLSLSNKDNLCVLINKFFFVGQIMSLTFFSLVCGSLVTHCEGSEIGERREKFAYICPTMIACCFIINKLFLLVRQ